MDKNPSRVLLIQGKKIGFSCHSRYIITIYKVPRITKIKELDFV
jgi:hypothetical protein